MSKKILILSAGSPKSFNFAKSLSSHYIVDGADIDKYLIQLGDYRKRIICPRRNCSDLSFIRFLIDMCKEYDMIIPSADGDLEKLRYLGEKEISKFFVPSQEVIETAMEKEKTLDTLRKFNIPTARPIAYPGLLVSINDLDITYPVWLRATRGAGGKASLLAYDRLTAEKWIDFWYHYDPRTEIVIEEYLPGANIAWQGIFYNGKHIVSQARERISYIFPHLTPSGITGTPTVARTVSGDFELTCIKAVSAIDKHPHGVYSIDLKGREIGTMCITEINAGRFHTTCNAYNELGLNMPLIYCKAFFGEPYEYLIPKHIPNNYYWIRHIDGRNRLIHGSVVDQSVEVWKS